MKTVTELKTLVGYEQTDSHFLAYLALLANRGVITLTDADITGDQVSDAFYRQVAGVYGIRLDSTLRITEA